jgi:hypothetical protein
MQPLQTDQETRRLLLALSIASGRPEDKFEADRLPYYAADTLPCCVASASPATTASVEPSASIDAAPRAPASMGTLGYSPCKSNYSTPLAVPGSDALTAEILPRVLVLSLEQSKGLFTSKTPMNGEKHRTP